MGILRDDSGAARDLGILNDFHMFVEATKQHTENAEVLYQLAPAYSFVIFYLRLKWQTQS